jgi:hypothetical protein
MWGPLQRVEGASAQRRNGGFVPGLGSPEMSLYFLKLVAADRIRVTHWRLTRMPFPSASTLPPSADACKRASKRPRRCPPGPAIETRPARASK